MALELVKHGGRELYRHTPEGAIKVKEKNGLGVAYVYPHSTLIGYIVVQAYAGNAARPAFHFRFRKPEQAETKIKEFFEGLAGHRARVEQYRRESNSGHTLKVGDIITNSWGYDQTNVDWYRITKTTRNFVWLEEIAAHVTETGFMSGDTTPSIDTTDPDPTKWGFKAGSEPPTKHKAQGDHVSMKFGSGSKWDGRPMHASWYA